MAILTLTSTAAQDTALIDFVARYNTAQRGLNPAWVDVTPKQFVAAYVNDRLDGILRDYTNANSVTKVEAYKLASAADQAAVDAILAKYQ